MAGASSCCRALRSRSENPVPRVLSRIRRPTGVRLAGARAGSSISARPPCVGLRGTLPRLLPAGPGWREARHNQGRSQWVSGSSVAAVRAHWASSAPGTGSVTGQRALLCGGLGERLFPIRLGFTVYSWVRLFIGSLWFPSLSQVCPQAGTDRRRRQRTEAVATFGARDSIGKGGKTQGLRIGL